MAKRIIQHHLVSSGNPITFSTLVKFLLANGLEFIIDDIDDLIDAGVLMVNYAPKPEVGMSHPLLDRYIVLDPHRLIEEATIIDARWRLSESDEEQPTRSSRGQFSGKKAGK